MTTIKAFTKTGQTLEWNYDDPADAEAVWTTIKTTGRSPGKEGALSRAYLWDENRGKGQAPSLVWAS
jgi:hypothetical protein